MLPLDTLKTLPGRRDRGPCGRAFIRSVLDALRGLEVCAFRLLVPTSSGSALPPVAPSRSW